MEFPLHYSNAVFLENFSSFIQPQILSTFSTSSYLASFNTEKEGNIAFLFFFYFSFLLTNKREKRISET